MTDAELDKIAASPGAGVSKEAKARIGKFAERARSDPAVKALFFKLADALRGVVDMRRLVGDDNDLCREFVERASADGKQAMAELERALGSVDLLVGMSDAALTYANQRGEKKAETGA